jgi:hypothetical protein
MSQTKNLIAKDSTIGDSAVDGLLAGLGAGIVMAIYLVAAGAIGGDSPAAVLSRFDPGDAAPVTGALMHLAVGSVCGMVFGVGYRYLRQSRLPSWLLGAIYGLALLLLAEAVILPGANSPLRAIPVWSFGAAHMLYGATLGLLVGRAVENSGGQAR